MDNWQEGDVESDGLKVHFYRTGNGSKPALVLAHGFTDNGLCWLRTAQKLESQFDIVMVDARNHGQSDSGTATLADLAGDLANLIRKLGLARPADMGHSVGASVVAALAAGYPDLVSRIVLEDPPWTLGEKILSDEKTKRRAEGFRQHIKSLAEVSEAQIIKEGRAQHPTWHPDEFPVWALSNHQVRGEAMERLDLGNWREPVPLIQCPTLLVYAAGSKDGIVSHELARELGLMNPRIQACHIDGAGHNLRREQFDKFINAVTPFLSEDL